MVKVLVTTVSAIEYGSRKRIKKELCNSIFKKGDCLTYVMDNGKYGGAFVLTDEENTGNGINCMAIITIDMRKKPTISDFELTDVYVANREAIRFENEQPVKCRRDFPHIGGFCATDYNPDLNIEVIGQLPINKEYIIPTNGHGVFNWLALTMLVPGIKKEIKRNGPPIQSLKLIELLNGINPFRDY